jgi:hypothetical protein
MGYSPLLLKLVDCKIPFLGETQGGLYAAGGAVLTLLFEWRFASEISANSSYNIITINLLEINNEPWDKFVKSS